MCDEPWTILGEEIPVYFSNLVLGFGLIVWLGARWAKRSRLNHDTIIDLVLFSLVMGVVGARILHVLVDGYFWDYVHLCTDPDKVEWHVVQQQCEAIEGRWDAAAGVCRPAEANCFAWAQFWQGGLTYYGGLAAAVPFCLWFLRRERFPLLKACDYAGMAIPFGLFWGRMGCFLGGCCYGTATNGPLGLRFPPWSPASEGQWRAGQLEAPWMQSLPAHPTQLYEGLGCLAIAALLMFVVHPRKRFDGQVLLTFLGSYAVLRFLLEFLRADDRGGLFGLSTSQLVGVGVLAAVAYAWGRLKERRDSLLATPPASP